MISYFKYLRTKFYLVPFVLRVISTIVTIIACSSFAVVLMYNKYDTETGDMFHVSIVEYYHIAVISFAFLATMGVFNLIWTYFDE